MSLHCFWQGSLERPRTLFSWRPSRQRTFSRFTHKTTLHTPIQTPRLISGAFLVLTLWQPDDLERPPSSLLAADVTLLHQASYYSERCRLIPCAKMSGNLPVCWAGFVPGDVTQSSFLCSRKTRQFFRHSGFPGCNFYYAYSISCRDMRRNTTQSRKSIFF